MKVFEFQHSPPVNAGCCNNRTTTTFWMAETRQQAEQEIAEHTPNKDRQDHGNCPICFASLLADGDYEILKVTNKGRN